MQPRTHHRPDLGLAFDHGDDFFDSTKSWLLVVVAGLADDDILTVDEADEPMFLADALAPAAVAVPGGYRFDPPDRCPSPRASTCLPAHRHMANRLRRRISSLKRGYGGDRGGLVAHAMAAHLRAEGERVGLLALLDTRPVGAATEHYSLPTEEELDRVLLKRDRTVTNPEIGVLAGKGAVVTGGSRGIGRAIVQRLAADGATVVFNFARSVDQAAEVERVVKDAGGHAHAVQIDLATPGAVDELMTCADQHLDGFDILVNNAVLNYANATIADTSEEQYDAVMAVNAKTTFLTMRHAARSMRDNGRIINISTLATTRHAPKSSLYVASKGAIEQLTKIAAMELGCRGITVNVVSPGATDTELLRQNNPEADLEQLAKQTPLGRLGQPSDIADVVALLAGHDGRWLTGQIIHATGGLLA